ncbi:hypothetical protein N825_37395 [Skermanella stibiiresistens SB22]|uniref:CHASE domain-containing protein n=1 Tax=Skermanella stibiiresistens SB22 TaxID=1385369 RepID=W9GPB6_9PROT|nr:hypothetical protein N825_37395 [Skermanella stibiiresistens SB22]
MTTGFRLVLDRRDQERFLHEVDQAQAAISDRMATYTAVLGATSALFAASDEVTRAEFGAFVARLDLRRRYVGIQAMGFSTRVAPDRIGHLEQDMRRQGFADFRAWPPGAREEINSIIFLEPLDDRNKTAIGFDMAVEPMRRPLRQDPVPVPLDRGSRLLSPEGLSSRRHPL